MSMIKILGHFFAEKWWNSPSEPDTSFNGKTILITGGTAGLGFEAAIKFVALGASTLIIGARNPEKAMKAKEAIEARTNRRGVVQIWELDMNTYSSVKAFANRVNRDIEHLDIAELNAGLVKRKYESSPEGWEETLQVNLLSTVLLGLLLLPKLEASGTNAIPSHLAFTSSGSHRMVKAEMVEVPGSILDHLNSPHEFNRDRQYMCSKLLLEYAVIGMAAIVSQTNGKTSVIVNSLCPGFCYSELSRDFSAWHEQVLKQIFFGTFARTAEVGSRTLVSGTIQGLESHGKFWKNDNYKM